MRIPILPLPFLLLAAGALAQPPVASTGAMPASALDGAPRGGVASGDPPRFSDTTSSPLGSPPASEPLPYDPLPNRVFFMPTGRLLPARRLAVETFDLLGLRAAYGLNDFMQIGVAGIFSPFKRYPSFISAGGKIRMLEPSGMFQGLSAGVDFGYLGMTTDPSFRGALQSYSLAATFGDDEGTFHLNAMGLPQGTSDTATLAVHYLFQSGLCIPLWSDGAHGGVMAMGEVGFGGKSLADIHTAFGAGGVRCFIEGFVWELGALLAPRCFGDCGPEDDGGMLRPFPYASAIWLF